MLHGRSRKRRIILAVDAGGLALTGLLFLIGELAGVGGELWGMVFLFRGALYTWVVNAVIRM